VDAPLAGFASGPSFEPDRRLREGNVLEAGGATLRVLHTPGHASDHLCYLLEGERLALTGDHVMHGSTVVIRPPDGEVAAYLDSLERLAAEQCEVLAPAHGRLLGDAPGAIAEVISHRQAREALIEAELHRVGRGSAVELLGSVYPGLEERRTEIATVTLLAHLQHLEDLGRIRSDIARAAQSTSTAFEAS
jgi:glyoxylase-like metal-dependent hydrolase (beta-lactamase superfamily II)